MQRLQKRTAARRYKCLHLGVRSSHVPGGVHLQKAANTNSSTRVKHMNFRVRSSPVPGNVHLQKAAKTSSSTRALFTFGGRCAGGVPLWEQMQGLCLQRPHSLRVCRWGKHQKREMRRLRRVGVLVWVSGHLYRSTVLSGSRWLERKSLVHNVRALAAAAAICSL